MKTCIVIAMIVMISTQVFGVEPIIDGDRGLKFHEAMKSLVKDGYRGTILIAEKGQIKLLQGYGLADEEKNLSNTPDTVFTMGSITKQFTGAAILKLEMDGKLSTKDKIGKYFGKIPKDKRKITIHHLLTHTSGLRGDFGDDFKPMTRDEIIERAKTGRLKFDVGEQHYYSNAGYSLLGAIIELVSGQSYEVYLRENIFLPAGMKDTGYLLPDWKDGRLAIGYEDDGKAWGTIRDYPWDTDGPYWNLRCNGGLLTTASDLFLWNESLKNHTILNKEAREKFEYPWVPEGPKAKTYYGYGWASATTERDTKLVAHNGGNGIFMADFRRYVDEDITIIYFTNEAPAMTTEMERNIRRAVFLVGSDGEKL
jgi:CubicO group peptidase (beta-lactamase class C family)